MTIRTAVVGAGRVAQQHLACLSGLAGVNLVGVADLSRALAESAAERYGAADWYTDLDRLLREARPDVVHVTTPPASHFRIAEACLQAGSHVFLEKPATVHFYEFQKLQALSAATGRHLVEDYNYLFNDPVLRLRERVLGGDLGDVAHVDVQLCLNILDPGHPAMDTNLHNPVLDLDGGVIADFLPHLASLACAFCGPARSVRSLWEKRTADSPLSYDELRVLLRGVDATATLSFSAHGQPDSFSVTVSGSRGRATADIFEHRLTHARLRSGPKPLMPLWNALDHARITRRSAWGLLWRKLGGGPGAYDGLWLLLERFYHSLASGSPPPITSDEMLEVNRLIDLVKARENRL